jgi:hypothetical protein
VRYSLLLSKNNKLVASEGDDAIPANTREVRQLGLSQPDIWPVLTGVCAG